MAISICIPTYNRLPHLKTTLKTIREGMGDYPYEIIIADGGSTDGTIEYLKNQDDVLLIEQGKLIGPVKSFNECFKKIKYEYVFWATDDFIVFSKVLIKCCNLMDKHPDIGMVSPKMIESTRSNFPNVGIFKNCLLLSKTHIFRYDVLKKINFLDERFKTYYVDVDSHLSVLNLGYTTIFSRETGVVHTRIHDETRRLNVSDDATFQKESKYYKQKWEELGMNLNVSSFNRFKVYIFWSLQNKLRHSNYMKCLMEKEKLFAIKLFDWVLQRCVMYNAMEYKKFKDFYMAQKLPLNSSSFNRRFPIVLGIDARL